MINAHFFTARRAHRFLAALFVGFLAHTSLAGDHAITFTAGLDDRNAQFDFLTPSEPRLHPVRLQFDTDHFFSSVTVNYVEPVGRFGIGPVTGKAVKMSANGPWLPLVDLVSRDVTTSLTYKLPNNATGKWSVETTGSVRVNNIDERLAAPGRAREYSVQLDLSRPLGALTLEIGAGQNRYSNLPGYHYRPAAFGYVGGTFEASTTKISFYTDYRQTTRTVGGNELEFSTSLTQQVTKHLALRAFASHVTSPGVAPDRTVGLVMNYSLN